ncbi:MAG: hypothetical protein JSW61_11450 [Candidatus Thorarchaeota archaeon]|nr:MAG: hypothetical protein JSW61_11450 [Candidatus Thorarchaeota archaeon]
MGFPKSESGDTSIEEKIGYLLEEIHALQERVQSLESTLRAILESLSAPQGQ